MMTMAIRRADPRDTPTAMATVLVLLFVDKDDPVGLEVEVLAPELAVRLLLSKGVVETSDNEDLTQGQTYSNKRILHIQQQSDIQGASVTHPICVTPVVLADTIDGTFAEQYAA